MKWNFLRNSPDFIAAVAMTITVSLSMEAAPTYLQTPADPQIFNDYGNHYFYCEGTPQQHKGASAVYNLAAPKAPLFHPYTIADDDLSNIDLRQVDLVPHSFCFPVFMRLSSEMVVRFKQQMPNILPDNIALDKIDCMIVVQNMPWIQGRPVLYRPHYYLEPNAPYLGRYQRNPNIQANLHFWKGHPVSFSRNQMCSSTHPAGGITVLSGAADASIVLNGVDNQQSSLFFSTLQGDGRYAVTLHVLLNDIDCDSLMEISRVCSSHGPLSLDDFVKGPLNYLGDHLGEQCLFKSLYTLIKNPIDLDSPLAERQPCLNRDIPSGFDHQFYLGNAPLLTQSLHGQTQEQRCRAAEEHYINHGRGEGRSYSRPIQVQTVVPTDFDHEFYLGNAPLLTQSVQGQTQQQRHRAAEDHYINHGRAEGRPYRR